MAGAWWYPGASPRDPRFHAGTWRPPHARALPRRRQNPARAKTVANAGTVTGFSPASPTVVAVVWAWRRLTERLAENPDQDRGTRRGTAPLAPVFTR
ncbi:hypothetical protein [Nocardiopsis tropica]|uniref:Uncharacterized protein n=1 Tax=Nocardiopsis tropica TaxID=109330 RepID=A0ABV2A4T5_9ACTN